MESTVINKITVTDDIAVITITPPQKMPHLAYTLLCELSDKKIREVELTSLNKYKFDKLSYYIEENTCCNSRTDYTGNVRSHSVHKKEVSGIFLLTDSL